MNESLENLQDADGNEKKSQSAEAKNAEREKRAESVDNQIKVALGESLEKQDRKERNKGAGEQTQPKVEENPIKIVVDSSPQAKEEKIETAATSIEEIKKEESRTKENPHQDYKNLNINVLIGEAEKLLKNEPVFQIRKQIFDIKTAINQRFKEEEEEARQRYILDGGNPQDFYFENPQKKNFYLIYSEFKKQLDAYNRNQEKQEQESLEARLAIIEELKAMYTDPSTGSTAMLFKAFRDLRTRWNNAGRIPRKDSRDVYRNYYHHLDNFYEYLNLNKELREMDYEHNLEIRKSIIKRTKALVEEKNAQKALNELQYLHKLWKEEAVPVAEEHRESTWQEFKSLTEKIHDRREEIQNLNKEEQELNLKKKTELIQEILDLSQTEGQKIMHSQWQKRIKKYEEIRKQFIATGRVPREVSQKTWDEFKEASRSFNRGKNAFYKELKSSQSENLTKKLALLEIAKKYSESEDWENGLNELKRIQNEWKKIGHVPRSHADRIWNEFKASCNQFFDGYKQRNKGRETEYFKNYDAKLEIVEALKTFETSGNIEEDLDRIQSLSSDWIQAGKVPRSKIQITDEYQNSLEAILGKLNLSESEIQEYKIQLKLKAFRISGDTRQLDQEIYRTKRKLEELEKEYKQLETNIQFFSNVDSDNPLVKDVYKQIQRKKEKIVETEILLRKLSALYISDEPEAEEKTETDK